MLGFWGKMLKDNEKWSGEKDLVKANFWEFKIARKVFVDNLIVVH